MAGVVASLTCVLRGRRLLGELLDRDELPANNPLTTYTRALATELGLTPPARVILSRDQLGPAVAGVRRPALILPEQLAASRGVEELRAVLVHELVHVTRSDTASSLLLSCVRALWWFHPLVRWGVTQADNLVERCIDLTVVRDLDTGLPEYARCLFLVLELRAVGALVPHAFHTTNTGTISMKSLISTFALSVALVASVANAQVVQVDGGATSVLLDTATLASAANLNLSGVALGIGAGSLAGSLAGSVAFPISPRTAASLPTTFAYNPARFLGTFSGTIEHTGSVFFNASAVEVGNISIGYDAARAVVLGATQPSGFFVRSTRGVAAILFDVAGPTTLEPASLSLTLQSNLLVSPEFAAFLQTNGLASTNLTGADVGDARVVATIPEPTAGAIAPLAIAGFAAKRRR
ncbi:MAG: M56 family metallopeptidase [Lacipirellulaceae bacterium]